ncbi:MAG: hypothetical protein JWM68_1081 [Verrucomicrobiales bacterium]|nr:hypothetical protein [Verrucomicrobiales bacterium]
MKQDITYNPGELLSLSAISLNGVHLHAAVLTIKQNTEAALLTDRIMLVGTRKAHEDAKLELSTRRETLDTTFEEARVYGTVIRDLVKPRFGPIYTNAYQALGLEGSILMPRNAAGLGPVLIAMKEFVDGHPEIQNADLNITPVHVQSVIDGLNAANNAVINQETEVKRLIKARDGAIRKLRTRLRGLANELEQLMDPLDERWLDFGFNMPGADETPDAPENVIATLIGPTAAAIKWSLTPRAEYYRIWKRVIGVDAEPIAVGSPADIDFTLENLPVGSTIEIYVSALNNGGESPLSEKITIVTH